MLTELHVSEIKTAADVLRRTWDDWQWETAREAMRALAARLDTVVSEASKWNPPGEPTPISDLHRGWWFTITGVGEDYVHIGGGTTTDTFMVFGPRLSKHGLGIEDLPEGITFYPAPSPTQLMAMCSDPKAKD